MSGTGPGMTGVSMRERWGFLLLVRFFYCFCTGTCFYIFAWGFFVRRSIFCVGGTLRRTRQTCRRSRVPMKTIIMYKGEVLTEARGRARALASMATRTRVLTVATTTGTLKKGCLGRYALCMAVRPYIVYTKTVN